VSVCKLITKRQIFSGGSDSKTKVKENLKGKKLCRTEYSLHCIRPLFHMNRFFRVKGYYRIFFTCNL